MMTILLVAALAAEPQVDVDLLVTPGTDAVDAAIRLRVTKPWHVYWQNPGDSGLPVRVIWTLPEGARADDLAWPVPQRFFDGTFATYGYEQELVLTTRLHGVASTDPIAATVSWLACDAECIPGSRQVTASATDDAAAVIAHARALVPRSAEPDLLSITEAPWSDGILTVRLAGSAAADVRAVFPEAVKGLIIDHGAITITPLTIRIPLRGQADALPLVVMTSAGALRLIVPLVP